MAPLSLLSLVQGLAMPQPSSPGDITPFPEAFFRRCIPPWLRAEQLWHEPFLSSPAAGLLRMNGGSATTGTGGRRGWGGGCHLLGGVRLPRGRRRAAELGSDDQHLCGSPAGRGRHRAACVPSLTLRFLSPPYPTFLPSPLRLPASVCACLSTCPSVCLSLFCLSPAPLGGAPFPSSNSWNQLISCSVCGGPFPAA